MVSPLWKYGKMLNQFWVSLWGKPLVQWFTGFAYGEIYWFNGSVVLLFSGSMVHWISIGGKLLVQWFSGSMVQWFTGFAYGEIYWFNGSVVLLFSGSMVHWISIGGKPLDQWFNGSLDFHRGKTIGSMVPWFSSGLRVQWFICLLTYPTCFEATPMFRNT